MPRFLSETRPLSDDARTGERPSRTSETHRRQRQVAHPLLDTDRPLTMSETCTKEGVADR